MQCLESHLEISRIGREIFLKVKSINNGRCDWSGFPPGESWAKLSLGRHPEDVAGPASLLESLR